MYRVIIILSLICGTAMAQVTCQTANGISNCRNASQPQKSYICQTAHGITKCNSVGQLQQALTCQTYNGITNCNGSLQQQPKQPKQLYLPPLSQTQQNPYQRSHVDLSRVGLDGIEQANRTTLAISSSQLQQAQAQQIAAQTQQIAAQTQQLASQTQHQDLENLLAVQKLIELNGTTEQKKAVHDAIQQKLEQTLPTAFRSYPTGTILVYASPGFHWAAQRAVGVISGRPIAVEASFSEVRKIADANPNIAGILEIELNVYQAFETVNANCYRTNGSLAWTEKTLLNAGGSPEQLAQNMMKRLLRKIEGKTCSQ